MEGNSGERAGGYLDADIGTAILVITEPDDNAKPPGDNSEIGMDNVEADGEREPGAGVGDRLVLARGLALGLVLGCCMTGAVVGMCKAVVDAGRAKKIARRSGGCEHDMGLEKARMRTAHETLSELKYNTRPK